MKAKEFVFALVKQKQLIIKNNYDNDKRRIERKDCAR